MYRRAAAPTLEHELHEVEFVAHVRASWADYQVTHFREIVDEFPSDLNGNVLKRPRRATSLPTG